MNQRLAIETLALIESINANIYEEESKAQALYNIKQDVIKYIATNNLELLECAELGKNQLFYLNLMRGIDWSSAYDLASRIKAHNSVVSRHLLSLEAKGYLISSEFEGVKYFKVKDKVLKK